MLFEFDKNFLLWLQENIRVQWATPIWKFITHLGDKGIIWIVLFVILLFNIKTRKVGIQGAIGLLMSLFICNFILKNAIARTRPFDEIEQLTYLIRRPHDYSFPSGHTCTAFVGATILYKNLPKKAGIPLILLACLISFSRLYLGVHYLTDVLCGMILGIIIAFIAMKIYEIFVNKIRRNSDENIKSE